MGEPSQNDRAEKLIGRVLSDRYRIEELVATGAMAAIYRGIHLNMRKEVAIKILHPETENFPELVTRFEREAVAGAHISHPNVAAVSDMGKFDEGSYFLVLELVKGRNLRTLMTEEGPISPFRAVHIVRQLAGALGAAHDKGIIHRDLKPLNVMVTSDDDERVKLIDFGLARVDIHEVAPLGDTRDPSKLPLSAAGVVFGTVGYMAPETALGMRAVDERSDLYSLGVILYEMIAGDHPFSAVDPIELFAQHRSQKPTPISERNPGASIPSGLEGLVMSLLEKDPTLRPANAKAVIASIDRAMLARAGPPVLEGPSQHAVTLPQPARSVAPKVFAAAALVVVVAVGLYILVASRHAATESPSASPVEPPKTAPATPLASAPPPVDPSAYGAKSLDDAKLATQFRNELMRSADASDPSDAASVLVSLAEVGPRALADEPTRRAATKVAERIGDRGGDEADRVYYALSYRFGSDGLDVLYGIREHADSARAKQRASSIIELQGASDRASPALRIALELQKAPCREKPLLFARAATEGDSRTMAVLDKLHPPQCDVKESPCCFRRNVQLEKAVNALHDKKG